MNRALRNLILLHLPGTAVILGTAYYWLGIGEANAGALTWSAAVALAVVCAMLWLHSSAMAHFLGGEQPLKTALRNLLPLTLVALLAAGVYLILSRWQEPNPQRALKVASYLTWKLRVPIKPSSVLRVFDGAFSLLRWWAAPVLLFPLMAAVTGAGWAGFRSPFWRAGKGWRYSLAVPALLLCASWLPYSLLQWTPRLQGFRWQLTSFTLRVLVAYLLAAGALLVLDYVTAGATTALGKAGWHAEPAEGPSNFAALIGAGPGGIQWSRAVVLFSAFFFASLAQLLYAASRHNDLELDEFRIQAMFSGPVRLAAALILFAAFRWIRRERLAVAASAAAVALLAWTGKAYLPEDQSSLPSMFLLVLAFAGSIVFALKRIRSTWLALAVGATASSVLYQILHEATLQLLQSKLAIWSREALAVAMAAVASVIFATILWAGTGAVGSGKPRISKGYWTSLYTWICGASAVLILTGLQLMTLQEYETWGFFVPIAFLIPTGLVLMIPVRRMRAASPPSAPGAGMLLGFVALCLSAGIPAAGPFLLVIAFVAGLILLARICDAVNATAPAVAALDPAS